MALWVECGLTTTRQKIIMKTGSSQVRLMAALGAISFLAVPAIFAEDTPAKEDETATSPPAIVDGVVAPAPTPAPAPAAAAAQTPAAPKETASTPKLRYGVEDVLKLSRSQVSEDVTLSFIQTSGTIYDLRPKDIVYLKEQGVSDKVINAMIDQKKKAIEVASQNAAAASQAAAVSAEAAASPIAAPFTPFAPSYADAAPIYAEPEPDYVPASTLYVIPYPAAAAAYNNYNYYHPYFAYGYYGSSRYYGGYCAPSTVYRFGCAPRGYARYCFRH